MDAVTSEQFKESGQSNPGKVEKEACTLPQSIPTGFENQPMHGESLPAQGTNQAFVLPSVYPSQYNNQAFPQTNAHPLQFNNQAFASPTNPHPSQHNNQTFPQSTPMIPALPDREEQEALSQLLLAWYQAGYAAGRYASIQQRKCFTVCNKRYYIIVQKQLFLR